MTQGTITTGQVRQVLAPFANIMRDFAAEMQEKLTEVDKIRNQERAGSRPDNARIFEALKDTFHEFTALTRSSRRYRRRLAPFNNLKTDWDHMSRPEFAKLTFENSGFWLQEFEGGLFKRWNNENFPLSDDTPPPVLMGFSLSLELPPRQHCIGRWESDGSTISIVYDRNKEKNFIRCGRDSYSTHHDFEINEEYDLKEILASWLLHYGREYSEATDSPNFLEPKPTS